MTSNHVEESVFALTEFRIFNAAKTGSTRSPSAAKWIDGW
jgi:hypothetical protein